ncbi:MAG: thiamine phosphate synthase [Acidobacteria bacterium]|nr:thiamine phosphate synthase [Acidobacteriota bacterium]
MALTYYITARQQLKPLPGSENVEQALQEKVRAAFSARVDYVQVREKDLPARRLARLVEELRALPEKQSTRLLVNERLDIALGCGADGVHLPSDSLPVSQVRSRAGEGSIVGVSCHSEPDVAQAAAGGADYVLLGPVFETPSKPDAHALGLVKLEEICRRFPIRVFALGGMDRGNAASCIRAGAAGVAGIRLFQGAENIEEICGYLRLL